MTLMGGEIGCDPWKADDGRSGNAFWLTLPATALPFREAGNGTLQAEVLAAIRAAEARPGFQEAMPIPDFATPDETAPEAARAERPRVPRTRVLLADDILANQLVTATLLRREGHMVDVVDTGDAAVQAVRETPYDLIFMDIFMPGMGGQEATRIIRSLPEPACLTPIIALTANVTSEDAAVFRAAGMDGILGKPVSLTELIDTVRTYVWSAREGDVKPSEPVAQAAKTRLPDPWAVLSLTRVRELRTNLPPETFTQLVEECLQDLEHRLPALRRAITAGTPAAITAHAHAMVGMAAGYGMAAMETRLRMILAAARDGDMLTLSPAAVNDVEADLAEAARMLREIAQTEVV
jgi:CheY-like chemotaxis protein